MARTILEVSGQCWGPDRLVVLIGRHTAIAEAQYSLLQFAQTSNPILITGETGTGKEIVARAITLLSHRRERSFLSVNCAQYHDGHLLATELFGHRRGSFTGATSDRLGLFEDANEGTVFLDEVGELAPAAQAMLLRVLSEGELVRVGENRPRRVDVRLLAATARNLEQMVSLGAFREDLYYRLRFLRVRIPPLRDRGDDWQLLLSYYLEALNVEWSGSKTFSCRALDVLGRYDWPGNVRELRSIVELAYHASRGDVIEPEAFIGELRPAPSAVPATASTSVLPPQTDSAHVEELYARMRLHGESFWDVVYQPFLERDLNRSEVRLVVAVGLAETRGSYKRLVELLGMEPRSYLKFMDFLRHHRLKPL